MTRNPTNDINELSSEKERKEKLLRMNKDKLKTLEKKQELLTKSGRNKFIFSLGLIAEKYLIEPEYLSEDDLDYILGVALTQPKVIGLMQKFSMLNKEKE
ncbi:MAG: hypothetical protein IKH65_05410 [Clostridia bacterium]|nr:hypothetical protein [Clostridia bacterium]